MLSPWQWGGGTGAAASLFWDAAGSGLAPVTGPGPPPAGGHSGAALVLPLIKGSLHHWQARAQPSAAPRRRGAGCQPGSSWIAPQLTWRRGSAAPFRPARADPRGFARFAARDGLRG